ncbi:hypothetical protein [Lactiplantibacillus pentosus]|uniref:hypothetical protein n=1 Tax=Lactiplantibacillus pentosus TaxID=1589 RepID=UPI0028B865CA|nr:hypothetical protein [Lactiplantibacillus pentosus]MBU7491041.1 hypothetical protein [Lactiplantibacillus pentosus]MDT6965444.1 hypothetical protein [Lactiplantibacillus pentosus]MDT7000766.1 hypothetical protein [Lactiplantibacillus pentosus]
MDTAIPIHDIIYNGRDATRVSGDSVRPRVLMAPRTTLPILTRTQKNFQTLTEQSSLEV